MSTVYRMDYDGSPCEATKTLGGTEMTCVMIDCDGEHHYYMAYTS